MNEAITIQATQADHDEFDYDSMISDPSTRDWAESAAGYITFGLGQAVVKVLEAGNLLIEAKQRLAHGEYLPWVQQACGLKPQHASKLIKAAEWMSNVAHAQHLDDITDATTLFLLSADTTPEEVREWFMERCAAGNPPSRREVQERKRSATAPRPPQPAEALAVKLIQKGDLDRVRQAVALAEQSRIISASDVLAEVNLRELPKGSQILGADADFHRLKDGNWVRLPHAGRAEAIPLQPVQQLPSAIRAVTFDRAAEILGCAATSIKQRLSPKQVAEKGTWYKAGYRVTKGSRGLVNLEPQP